MEGLPRELLSDALVALVGERDAAYLVVDGAGLVARCGGALRAFDLGGLAPGDEAEERAPWLVGLLPPRGEQLTVPALACGDAATADLHLWRSGEETAVLLVDVGTEIERLRALQQRTHELELELARGGAAPAPAEVVLARLGTAVWERGEAGALRLVGVAPDWVRELSARGRDPIRELLFLEHFLVDAEAHWASGSGELLTSGLWSEPRPDGTEWALQALACTARGRRLLLVELASEKHRRQQALIQRARETSLDLARLQREVQKKEVLLHCIVHDLKGPLTGMMGSLSLLRGRRQGEDRVTYLAELGLRQARRQAEMIRVVLDVFSSEISQLESYEFHEARAPDALALARQAVESFRPAFHHRQVGIRLVAPKGTEALPVVGQEQRLHRVLSNLLDNALRYAPPGSTVRVRVEPEEDTVELSVEDEGPGVAEEAEATLFEKFRGDPRQGGVAGLGLYYCRITVEQWGGGIVHERPAEGGARFRLTLPRAAR